MWQKIELLINAQGLNWADLARLIGVKDSRISKWRSGTGEVDRRQLLRIAKVLETGVEYLADDTLEESSAPQQLPEDEIFVLKTYRMLKRTKGIDEELAVAGMSSMGDSEPKRAPVPADSGRPQPPPGIDPSYRHPAIPSEPWEGVRDHTAERAEAEAKQAAAAAKRKPRTKQG